MPLDESIMACCRTRTLTVPVPARGRSRRHVSSPAVSSRLEAEGLRRMSESITG